MLFWKTVDDDELNIAFVEGQDISLETSVRDSMSAISEIREQLQTDSMEGCSTTVSFTNKPFIIYCNVTLEGRLAKEGRELPWTCRHNLKPS